MLKTISALYHSVLERLALKDEKEDIPKTTIEHIEELATMLQPGLLLNRTSRLGNVLTIHCAYPNAEELIACILENTQAIEQENKASLSWQVPETQRLYWMDFLVTHDGYPLDESMTFATLKTSILDYCQMVKKYAHDDVGVRAYLLRRLRDFNHHLFDFMQELVEFSLRS